MEEVAYDTSLKASEEASSDISFIIKESVTTPTRAAKIRRAYSLPRPSRSVPSDKALAMIVAGNLSVKGSKIVSYTAKEIAKYPLSRPTSMYWMQVKNATLPAKLFLTHLQRFLNNHSWIASIRNDAGLKSISFGLCNGCLKR